MNGNPINSKPIALRQLRHHANQIAPQQLRKNIMPFPCQKAADVPITTMMVRNIPCRVKQEEFMQAIDQLGFSQEKYDFFYLPLDRRRRTNLGYAFINFKDQDIAAQFRARMYQYRFVRTHSASVKTIVVVPATIQGFEASLEHFSETAVLKGEQRPFFSRHDNQLTA